MIAWTQQEFGCQVVDKLLAVAVVPASAMTEALYRLQERGHRLPPADMRLALLALGVREEPVAAEDAVRAAELITQSRKSQSRDRGKSLSLGDGLCIAVAERLQLPVTGGDQHWAECDLRVDFLPFR